MKSLRILISIAACTLTLFIYSSERPESKTPIKAHHYEVQPILSRPKQSKFPKINTPSRPAQKSEPKGKTESKGKKENLLKRILIKNFLTSLVEDNFSLLDTTYTQSHYVPMKALFSGKDFNSPRPAYNPLRPGYQRIVPNPPHMKSYYSQRTFTAQG